MNVRPLDVEDIECFIAFHIAHTKESGSDGDPHFGPYDRDEPYPRDGAVERTRTQWMRSIDVPEWRRAWGLFAEKNLVGAASLSGGSLRTELHRVQLGVGVLRSYRERGGGRQLMDSIIAWCTKQPSIDWIDLGVIGQNSIAVALYLKLGFEITGRTPDRWRLDGCAVEETFMALRVTE